MLVFDEKKKGDRRKKIYISLGQQTFPETDEFDVNDEERGHQKSN